MPHKAVFLGVSYNLFSVKYYLSGDCHCQPQNLQKSEGHSFIAYYTLEVKLFVSLFSYQFQWLNAEPNLLDQLCMQFKRLVNSSKMQRYYIPLPGLATYFRFSFRFFKKSSCQLLAKVCARSTG